MAAHEASVLGAEVPTLLLRASQPSYRNSGEGMGVDDTTSEDLEWGQWVEGIFELEAIAAHHYSILNQPAVRQVAERISGFLQRYCRQEG